MNYILSQINRKIGLLQSLDKKSELKVHLQAKLEFYLNYILGYLWNKNFEIISDEDKELVISTILKPSIGSIISTARTLDVCSEFFGNTKLKKFIKAINEYPEIRNEKIGHGFAFEDDVDNFIAIFERLIEMIEESVDNITNIEQDLVLVSSLNNNVYSGVLFKSNGADYHAWSCPYEVQMFLVGSLYIKSETHGYNRITPFVHLENENDFFIFSTIEEKLTGRIKYNQLIRSGKKYIEYEELATIDIINDGIKRKTSNGTIINHYTRNYKKYIDVGVTNQIIKFLTQNKSSVFATLWGHGGIGKTAAIQNACEILVNNERKKFDYIIFISAKDRYYNYYKGVVQEIKGTIKTLDEIVQFINNLIFEDLSNNADNIKLYEGDLLIVIDDFETFSKNEKQNIISFIRGLNINHHKVILTTRSATLITGEEIETNELSPEQTIIFLVEALKNELPSYNVTKDLKGFKKNAQLIHNITSGRPLFILQFAILLAQKGSLEETLSVDIKSSEEAKNFIYYRIYDYFSLDAKNMFLAINLLVDKDDLTGLIDNLKFILNKEENEEAFDDALNELLKLKIIELEDKDLFKVYSPAILKVILTYYENKGREYDGDITNRFNLINSDEDLETDSALLKVANSNRLIASEDEVENQYRRIIKRESASIDIRVKALLNFASYLFTQKSKVDKTIKLFNDYWHWFNRVPVFIIMQARYCWAEGSVETKYKATDVLKGFLARNPKIDEEIYLEIIGTLMTYSTSILVSERENLKDQKRFGEIAKQEYEILNKDQRQRFIELFRYPGSKLYSLTKDKDLMTLTPKCRNFVLDGLVHFSEVCIRVNKRDIAKAICEKIFSELPSDYHKPFQHKIRKIDFIDNGRKSTKKNEGDSDLAIKLKEALNNN
jgi:hypothetical protein